MKAEDQSIFQNLEQTESEQPSVLGSADGSTVYKTRFFTKEITGIPILTDFGQMRIDDSVNDDWVMPDLYRAPEVLLGLPWSFPVDIWSLGVMVNRMASSLGLVYANRKYRLLNCWRGKICSTQSIATTTNMSSR